MFSMMDHSLSLTLTTVNHSLSLSLSLTLSHTLSLSCKVSGSHPPVFKYRDQSDPREERADLVHATERRMTQYR